MIEKAELTDNAMNQIVEVVKPILEKKDKEIERLNKEIKEYQEELEKADSITQSCIFEGKEEATKSYRECLNLLERLHSIIKEVREYVNNIMFETKAEEKIQDDILEIINKVEDKK